MKSPAAQFRRSAAALQKKITKKRAPRKTNTRKRISEWKSALADARQMELLQDRLLTLAEMWSDGTVPSELQSITQKQQVEYLLTSSTYPGVKDVHAYDFLREADITTAEEYTAARAALLAIGDPDAGTIRPETVIREKELALPRIDGFYPTPRQLVERLLKYTDIQPGDYVLEPSAGRGDIATVIRDLHPQAIIHCVEYMVSLREILDLKGFKVMGDDIFTYQHDPLYKWIIMNPPFENGADAQHVQHVYENFLAPGGTLVAITSAGVQFRDDYANFRNWLSEHDGHSAALPPKSFADADVSTGVATQMLVVAKPDASGAVPEIDFDEESYVEPTLWPGTWVQHEDGRKGRIDGVIDGKYSVRGEVRSMEELMQPLERQYLWHPSKVTKIDYPDVAYHWLHVQILEMESTIHGYVMSKNLQKLGYGDMDLTSPILRWAATRVDVARRIRKHWDQPYSELFTLDQCKPYAHKDKEYETEYSRPPSQEELDSLVESGLLGYYAEHYYITEAGVQSLKKDWAEYQPHIEAALDKLQATIFYADVLEEVFALIASPQIDKDTTPPQRVYIPRRNAYGTIKERHNGAAVVLLDDGIAIQLRQKDIQPIENGAIGAIKEERSQSPLNERSDRPVSLADDSPAKHQLPLF